MTEYRNKFELYLRRGKGESPGVGMSDTLARRSGRLTIGAAEAGAPLLALTIAPYTSERIQRAELLVTAGADVDTKLETWLGLGGWAVTQPAAFAFAANAVGDATIELGQVGYDYKDLLQITGAAAALVNNLAGPATIEYNVLVSKDLHTAHSTSVLLDTYFDDSVDTLPNMGPLSVKTLNKIQAQGGGTLLLAQNGNTLITANNCAAAFGLGPPIILATDEGLAFGQIPVAQADWSAARFAPHPRCFIRPSAHTWGIRQLTPFPVTGERALVDDLALRPLIASRRPTHSLWRILLEGELQDVIIAHPATLDVRRPRDIWNRIWNHHIAGAELPIYGTFGALGLRNFYQEGVLRNLHFLDYALCLDLYDGGDTPLLLFPDPPPPIPG